jgi:CubicO group peptidase (beta-lactamase class C family)
LAIIQGGRIVEARAYGVTDSGGGKTVDTTTLFQAGSISKSVSALGALHLVEQHKLDLDSDVNATLKTWKVPPNQFTSTKPVTLRELLSHTAGLTVHGFPGYAIDAPKPTLVQVLDSSGPANTAPIRVDAEPGSRWNYSGGGYTVMQQMMLDVTGKTFPEFMRETVLAPLGMVRSTFEQPPAPARAALTAAGHYPDGSEVKGRWHVYPEMAAAGLWTTPSDLARFAIEVQRAYAGRSSKVISQAMAKQMLTDQKDMDGLGVFLQGAAPGMRFNHNGRDEGFDAMMTRARWPESRTSSRRSIIGQMLPTTLLPALSRFRLRSSTRWRGATRCGRIRCWHSCRVMADSSPQSAATPTRSSSRSATIVSHRRIDRRAWFSSVTRRARLPV